MVLMPPCCGICSPASSLLSSSDIAGIRQAEALESGDPSAMKQGFFFSKRRSRFNISLVNASPDSVRSGHISLRLVLFFLQFFCLLLVALVSGMADKFQEISIIIDLLAVSPSRLLLLDTPSILKYKRFFWI